MNTRLYIPTLAVFLLISLKLNAQGPGLVIDSAVGQTGQTVCIPVRAKGFFEVITMQGKISWNPQVLDCQFTQNYYPSLCMTAVNFHYDPQGKYILLSWADTDASCISVDDNEVLFEICFWVIGSVDSSSIISIDTAVIINCNSQDIWSFVESPPALFWVTTVTNAPEPGLSFSLSPNPTQGGTQVIFDSQKDGTATLFVTNPLGQTVLEQKVSISIGENKIEVPAGVLKMAGIYQVSLQTEQTVTSHLLFVN